MKQRIITGACLVLFSLAVIFLSHTLVYPIVLTLLCVVGVREMLKCTASWQSPELAIPSMLFAVIYPILTLEYRYGVLISVTLIYMFLLLILLVLANEKLSLDKVCTTFVTVVYITICFSCLLRLRYVTATTANFSGEIIGQYFYLLVFVAAWVTDTFAYFTGVFFGKHKLCPKISPKKTIEGSIGGTAFCVIGFMIYGLAVSKINPDFVPNYAGLALVGLLMSVLSQLGDLLASVIKRTYGLKDYGKLFPGHGGVLDRFDSVLITAPLLLLLVEDAQFLQLIFKL